MSSYHRKQYVQIAALLKDTGASNHIVEAFIELFQEDNHRFDEEKFIAALEEDDEGYYFGEVA